MALGSCYISFFQTHFRSVINSKDFRRLMMRATQKWQAITTLKKHYWTSSERFTSVTCCFHFWIGSQSVGMTFTIQFFQVQLDWSHWNISLPIEHLFCINFHQSDKWLSLVLCTSAWPSLCASLLVFFSIFKLIAFTALNENFFYTNVFTQIVEHVEQKQPKVFRLECR